MKRYYSRVTNGQLRAQKGMKSGYATSHTPKKYDRAKLVCTHEGCDNEFFVSKASTPAKRMCHEHFVEASKPKPAASQILAALGLSI